MAKVDREQLLHEGENLLESWGVPAGAAAASLEEYAGRSAAADVAIAHRLGGAGGEESVGLLRRIEQAAAEKLARKEAKRALYRLQQRGVRVPEIPSGAPVTIAAPSLEGYVSPIDGRGDQLVWLLKSRTGGALHLFAVLNDPDGMREADLTLITRRGLKAVRAELEAKHELRLVEADWGYCDFLMRRAFRWARERAARIGGDFPALRAQMIPSPGAEEMRPLIFSHLVPPLLDEEPDALARSAEVLAEPEFRTWFFTREDLAPYLEELTSIRESPIVLDRTQQEERFRAVIDRALAELFGGARRESWARRLYEMAYFLWASARREKARSAAAVARALERSERGGRELPFCEHLTRASLAALFEAAVKEEAERARDSLVLTPQQAESRRGRH